jgi:hypothetical protein
MQEQVPHIATVESPERYLDADLQEEIRANHVEACRELHERFVSIAKRRGELDALEAEAIIEAIEMRPWLQYGVTTLTAYLEHVFGYGPRVAVERERVARELMDLPDLRESLRHGLPWTKARELTRVATRDTEGLWLDAATGMNLREVEALVRGHKKGDLPTDPTKPELTRRPRTFEMTDETYALFRQWQAMVSDECGELIDDELALATAFQRGISGNSSERAPAQVAFTICSNCRSATVDGAGIVVDVSPETRDRALCDSECIGDLDVETPARVTSSVTPRVRRQVLARDHGRCTVPGCRSTFGLQIHHLEHQENGGGHSCKNCICLCSAHHQLHHDGTLAIRREGPRIRYRRILDYEDGVEELGEYDLTGSLD